MMPQVELPLNQIVLRIRNGTTTRQNTDGSGYKVSRIETISNEEINPDRVKYVQLSDNELEKWRIKQGDILVSHINSVEHIGKSAIYKGVPETLIHGMNLLLLRPNTKRVEPAYLAYFLKSSNARNFIRARCKKAINQASISQRELGELPVTVPSLGEQQRIVSILDRAAKIERLKKEAQERLREFIPALFVKRFGDPVENPMGWPRRNIGQVCMQTEVRDPRKTPAAEFHYVDISGVDSVHKKIVTTRVLTGNNAPSRARKEIRKDDIIVSSVRPNLNAVAVVPNELDREIASTGFCVLRANPELIDPLYLFCHVTSTFFVETIWSQVRGANYPAVSDKDIKDAWINVPPLNEQKPFTKIVESARATFKLEMSGTLVANKLTASLMSHLLEECA